MVPNALIGLEDGLNGSWPEQRMNGCSVVEYCVESKCAEGRVVTKECSKERRTSDECKRACRMALKE